MNRITLKSSTVFVAVDDETRVFRSVDEVPPEWRRRFERPKGGLKPQTILIADRKGREEIMRSLQGQPSSVQTRWRAPQQQQPASAASQNLGGSGSSAASLPAFTATTLPLGLSRGSSGPAWRNPQIWAEIGFVAALGAAIWVTFWY